MLLLAFLACRPEADQDVKDDLPPLSDTADTSGSTDTALDSADSGATDTDAPAEPDVGRTFVSYLGGPSFSDVVALDDGSFLAVGSAADLGWASDAVILDAAAITGQPSDGVYGVLVHFSADMRDVLSVRALPAGASGGLVRVVARGSRVWISGTTRADKSAGTGMFLAATSVDGSSLDWVYNVWADGDHRARQPWDVDGAGYLTFVSGQEFGYDWAAIQRLGPDGARMPVEGWRTHWTDAGEEHFSPISSRPDLTVSYSAVVLKAWGRCDLRS